MNDPKRLLFYGLGTAVAIFVIGAGIWYLIQEEQDAYEEAKRKIA